MSHGRTDDFSPLSPADDQDVRVDRLDGGDCFERWVAFDETDGVARMKLRNLGPTAAVLLGNGEVEHLDPNEIVRRIAPRNVRIQVG